jgi:4-aminobutyrate aminotransferase
MFQQLRDLQSRYPFFGDVRGKGLMIGVELVGEEKTPAPRLANAFLDISRDEGLLVGKGGLYGNVLRLTPPMTISEDEVTEALEKIGRTCARVARL